MHIKKTISLLLSLQSLLCGNSAAMDHTYSSIQKLKEIGAWYDPEPEGRAPLDENIVMSSPFWHKIKQNMTESGAFSEQDENEIENVCRSLRNSDHTRHVRRFNIAAALYLGINTECQWMQEALSVFVLYDDCPLVALMLKKGCNPNAVYVGEYIIFRAKTVAMAELLRNNGANFNVTTCDRTLLHDIFVHDKDSALIPYYIQYGVDPMQQDGDGQTALEEGIMYHGFCGDKQQNIIDRVAGFMEAGVSEDDILAVGQKNKIYQPYVVKAIGLYYKNKK